MKGWSDKGENIILHEYAVVQLCAAVFVGSAGWCIVFTAVLLPDVYGRSETQARNSGVKGED